MYAKVQRSIWRHPGIRALPEDARNLFFYLITCSHGYDIGIFELPDAYACDDLLWSQERFNNARQSLIQANRAYWDLPLNLVCLPHSIKHNPPANPKVLVRWQLQFEALPPTALFAYPIKCAKDTILDTWAKPFLDYIDTLSIRYQNLINTVSITVAPYPIPHTVTVAEEDKPPTPLTPQAVNEVSASSSSETVNVQATNEAKHVKSPLVNEFTAEQQTCVDAYSQNIGLCTPIIGDNICLAIQDFTAQWVLDAIKESATHEKRSWAYVIKVLQTWKQQGRNNGLKGVKRGEIKQFTTSTTDIVQQGIDSDRREAAKAAARAAGNKPKPR